MKKTLLNLISNTTYWKDMPRNINRVVPFEIKCINFNCKKINKRNKNSYRPYYVNMRCIIAI